MDDWDKSGMNQGVRKGWHEPSHKERKAADVCGTRCEQTQDHRCVRGMHLVWFSVSELCDCCWGAVRKKSLWPVLPQTCWHNDQTHSFGICLNTVRQSNFWLVSERELADPLCPTPPLYEVEGHSWPWLVWGPLTQCVWGGCKQFMWLPFDLPALGEGSL